MPANFTRRLDLFHDAGFPDPEGAVKELTSLVALQPTEQHPMAATLAAAARAQIQLPLDLTRLATLVPELLFARQGDLSTLLWLAGKEHAGALPLGAFMVALLDAVFAAGRGAEALALLRFLVDVDFDFGRLYGEKGPSYGFFREREPNPFVFKLLEYFQSRERQLTILDLGAGIGNDALGFLGSERVKRSPKVKDYFAADLSAEELEKARQRANDPRLHLLQGDFVSLLADPARLGEVNLIYSYSSLHYFNSKELDEILTRAHTLLLPRRGHLAFAIKGAGSVWDGQGVPLYRPDVWINLDGQSRWFPSVGAIDALVDRHGFALKLHELHEHWGYSETGKRDIFHYVLCEAV